MIASLTLTAAASAPRPAPYVFKTEKLLMLAWTAFLLMLLAIVVAAWVRRLSGLLSALHSGTIRLSGGAGRTIHRTAEPWRFRGALWWRAAQLILTPLGLGWLGLMLFIALLGLFR